MEKNSKSIHPIPIKDRGMPKTNSLNPTEFNAMMLHLEQNGTIPLWKYVDYLFDSKTQGNIDTALKLMNENMNYFTNLFQS